MVMANSDSLFDGLLLGLLMEQRRRGFGFRSAQSMDGIPAGADANDKSPMTYAGDSHLMTFAPTG